VNSGKEQESDNEVENVWDGMKHIGDSDGENETESNVKRKVRKKIRAG